MVHGLLLVQKIADSFSLTRYHLTFKKKYFHKLNLSKQYYNINKQQQFTYFTYDNCRVFFFFNSTINSQTVVYNIHTYMNCVLFPCHNMIESSFKMLDTCMYI